MVKDRADIDALYGRKAGSWLVSWAEGRTIFLLEKEGYEKESSHRYDEERYLRLIKHELSHLFYESVVGSDKPRWLNEGISVYVSDQLTEATKINCPSKFLDYFDTSGVKPEAFNIIFAKVYGSAPEYKWFNSKSHTYSRNTNS